MQQGPILLVDDDALISMTSRMSLEDLGHTVLVAMSGNEALSILRAGSKVDLVVTDQGMPGMTGLQLAARIREEWPDLPVLLATGYDELPGGGKSVPRLSKPYSQEDLAMRIAEMTGTTQSNAATIVPIRPRADHL